MRDYISHKVQDISKLIDDLRRQEQSADEARRQRNSQQRTEAEDRAKTVQKQLLEDAPAAMLYEFLDVTRIANATNLRKTWQEKNRSVDCLQPLLKNWEDGRSYFQIFATPAIDLSLLPAYSFVIQLTFTLAQPYISRDEQNFYIIENPVRKDKLFGLPYVASTSWKGSLRSACWHMKYKKESDEDKKEKATIMLHLFGNEKNIGEDARLDVEDKKGVEEDSLEDKKENEEDARFHAGCLQFFPTFFTMKSLEVINPQDCERRAGTDPIVFESVPEGSEGTFTLLYVPFDLIGEDGEKTRDQVIQDLGLVAQGIQAMFRIYGFGAKTSSGFGLARESVRGRLSTQAETREFGSFTKLVTLVANEKII